MSFDGTMTAPGVSPPLEVNRALPLSATVVSAYYPLLAPEKKTKNFEKSGTCMVLGRPAALLHMPAEDLKNVLIELLAMRLGQRAQAVPQLGRARPQVQGPVIVEAPVWFPHGFAHPDLPWRILAHP